MTDTSDSEDDLQIKQLLEAADSTLLNNSMFQKNTDLPECNIPLKNELPKSQRHLSQEDIISPHDILIPDSVQKHMVKKLSEVLSEKYEFFTSTNNAQTKPTKYKNRLKLLNDADCYVNSYDFLQDDFKGPLKKPTIQRRVINETICNEETLEELAVNGSYILDGSDMKHWHKKKERPDKVFHYKMNNKGVLYAKEDINEFSSLRRRNKWNENQIRNFNFKSNKR